MIKNKIKKLAFYITLLTLSTASIAHSASKADDIGWNQKIGTVIRSETASAPYTEETGKSILLRDALLTGKPTLLSLVYYGCPNLCTLVLNGLVQSITDLEKSSDLKVGRDFNLLSVTIDTHESFRLALAKQRSYLARLNLDPAGQMGIWHFLSANSSQPTAVELLAEDVGFRYRYDPVAEQYAHPSGIVVLDSNGKIIQYLTGIQFKSSDLISAIELAREKRTGSVVEDLVLICSHYNPFSTANTRRVIIGIQILSGLFVLAFLGMGLWYARRDSLRRRSATS